MTSQPIRDSVILRDRPVAAAQQRADGHLQNVDRRAEAAAVKAPGLRSASSNSIVDYTIVPQYVFRNNNGFKQCVPIDVITQQHK
jgi:hypothetical protein